MRRTRSASSLVVAGFLAAAAPLAFAQEPMASLLDAGGDDVAAAMAAQEAQLRMQRAATDDALDALRRARRQLATTGLRLVA